ncbi:hypothetical protein SAMN04487947_1231 [Halogeometricum rufum]|uniref:Uncharacterized protein n=1 Tax=Halogeometricum rufum TaxID=553469 RepID=A0A1I6GJ43_9EURY|nr:hypothetical protein [Halogeometricum rufum]SFR42159.1 hypothetical protein SAMN04487947_1231 [Halogeometricum rufum]
MGKSPAAIDGKRFLDDEPYVEGEAGEDLTPGELVEQTGTTSDGTPILAPVDSVDKTDAEVMLIEVPSTPPLRNADTTTDPIDDTITSGTVVQAMVLRSGDTAQNALLASGTDLSAAADADISAGDILGSYSDGSLKATTTAGAGLLVATEAVDNSGAAAGERARINVRRI